MTYTKEEVEDIVSKLINDILVHIDERELINRQDADRNAKLFAENDGENKLFLQEYKICSYAVDELISVKSKVAQVFVEKLSEYMKKDEK